MFNANATTSEIVSMVKVDQNNINVNKETILELCTRISHLSLDLSRINSELSCSTNSNNQELINEKIKLITEINEISEKIGELTKKISVQTGENSEVSKTLDTLETVETPYTVLSATDIDTDTGTSDTVNSPISFVNKEQASLPVVLDIVNENNTKETLKNVVKEPVKENLLTKAKFPTKIASVTFKASITIPKKEGKVNTTTMTIDDTFKGSSIQDLINTLKEWLFDDNILVENMEYSVKQFTIKSKRLSKGWSPTSIQLDIHSTNINGFTRIKITEKETVEQHRQVFKKRFTEIIFMLEMLDY